MQGVVFGKDCTKIELFITRGAKTPTNKVRGPIRTCNTEAKVLKRVDIVHFLREMAINIIIGFVDGCVKT